MQCSPWAATPPAVSLLLHSNLPTFLGRRLVSGPFPGEDNEAQYRGAPGCCRSTQQPGALQRRLPSLLVGMRGVLLELQPPCPQPLPLAQCKGSPRPKATQLVCDRAGLAHAARDNPIPSLGPEGPAEGAGRHQGSPGPSCIPASPLAELPALSLAARCMAPSYWTQGHGCCPHLSSALTGSVMAL